MAAWLDQPRTLAELEALPGEVLTCQQIAPILGANPATIHGQAVERPEKLGFPVIVMGRRVKIPKQPFVRFLREGV
jgi:hypothetical protein